MSGNFNLADYVDVAERLGVFKKAFPMGSLQGRGEFVRDEAGAIVGYIYRAEAYRDPDDTRPGVGSAFEPIPGKTPYTRDSEVQNAETSAWGRAIVALGFETKKIASANEVRNRQPADVPPPFEPGVEATHDPMNTVLTFGKYKGSRIHEVPTAYKEWLVEKYEPKTPEQHTILQAVKDDLSIPF